MFGDENSNKTCSLLFKFDAFEVLFMFEINLSSVPMYKDLLLRIEYKL